MRETNLIVLKSIKLVQEALLRFFLQQFPSLKNVTTAPTPRSSTLEERGCHLTAAVCPTAQSLLPKSGKQRV